MRKNPRNTHESRGFSLIECSGDEEVTEHPADEKVS
jgi:hypothetical protein